MNPISHAKVEMLSISSLTPNPRNARKHSDQQIEQIAASISRFGFLVPIIIDSNGMIVAGHGRQASWPYGSSRNPRWVLERH